MIGDIEISWVMPSDLTSRIDAEYYQRRYIEAQSRLNSIHCVSFYKLWKDAYRIYMGIKGYDALINNRGFTPYLRPVDIDDHGYIDFNQLGWCDANWLKDYGEQGTAKPNDLIVEVKGNTRKVAVLPAKVPESCIVSGSAWRIQVSDKSDPYFIQAYLLSETGQILKRREISNSIIPWIDPEAFKKLSIPHPDPKIQNYIGDKVRLAEKCREEARTNRKKIEDLLNQYAKRLEVIELLNRTQEPSHVVNRELIDDRMDAEFYQQTYLQLDDLIRSTGYLTLEEIIFLPIKGTQPDYAPNGTVVALTGTNIDANVIDIIKALRVHSDWVERKAKKALAAEGEVLFTVTGPPLGEAAVVHQFHCPLVINSHIARIKVRGHFSYPFYLAAILNSVIISTQVYRYCKGVRQKELYPEDIMRFVIPKVDTEIVCQIDELGYIADSLEYRAKNLILEAIADVERLIDGKLNLQEIIFGKLKAPAWEEIQHQIQRTHA